MEVIGNVMKPEEGIDYQVMPKGFKDPRKFNEKVLEKEIRRSI